MYVTDDEAAKLAFETVQELAELDEDQCYELANDTDDIVLEIKPIEDESENHLIAENLPKESTEVNALQKEVLNYVGKCRVVLYSRNVMLHVRKIYYLERKEGRTDN